MTDDAREHAQRAAQLLSGDPLRRGPDTLAAAQAHALTAIALVLAPEPPDPNAPF